MNCALFTRRIYHPKFQLDDYDPFTQLTFLITPVMFIGWFIAVKEALDLDWVPTIVTVVIGWIALIVINLVAGVVIAALGFGGLALFG